MKKRFKTIALILTIALCFPLLSGCAFFDIMDNPTKTDNPKVTPITSVFDGDCGITASAEIENNILNYPELSITVTNTSNKNIFAIKFYAVHKNVYGEEINSIFAQNKLYTDSTISVGNTTTLTYSLLDQSIKNVTLYVYSVYFEDGTEWGNKDASTKAILADAPTIEVATIS